MNDMNRYIALQKIVEYGSFTRAAEALGYTQSGMSQMIASLEEDLAIKLLYRSRVGIKLTLEGKELYPFIERAILQYQAMLGKAIEIKGLDIGIIRIGAIASISCHWLPPLISGFQEKYPNVQFILHQGEHTSIQEWIKVGAVDFGFVTPPAVTGLETIPVKNGDMKVILPVNHPLAVKNSICLQEIAEEPFILLEEGHYNEHLEAFRAFGITPAIKYTIHDDYTIMAMVEAGLGISILSDLILQRANYNIIQLPIDPPVTRSLAIGYKDKNSLPIASKYFIDYLLGHIESLP